MRTTKVVACAAAVGNMLNGWDSATLAGALLYISPEFNLSSKPELKGAIAAASLVGAAVSTTFAGTGADLLGRRKMLCFSASLYCLGALLMLWSPNVYMLLVARLIDGIGVGLAVTVAPLYISEVSPAEIRGELNTLPQLLGSSGVFLAYCMVFGLSLTSSPSWRMMLGVLFIPSVIYFILGILYLPESPRWLAGKGQKKEAEKVLQYLRNKENVKEELALLVAGLDGVGEDPVLEEYIIKPVRDPDALSTRAGSDTMLFSNDGVPFIAMPLSRIASTHGLSRPSSLMQQTVPSVPFVNPAVSLTELVHGLNLESAFSDEGVIDEEKPAYGDYSEEDMHGDLTSPLISRHPSDHSEKSEIAHPQDGMNASRSGDGGWQVFWQWTGPLGTEDQPGKGTYKAIYLSKGDSVTSLPNLSSTTGEIQEIIPAAAIVGRPSQYGKEMEATAPAKTFSAWSQLLEGGVRQALFVGVTLQILEQFGGINAVLNFTPQILQESGADTLLSSMGVGSDSASILASAVTHLITLPFIISAMRLMDVVGRRKILLTTLPILVLALLCLIIINLVPASDAVFSTVSVLSVVIYVIFFVTGFGPIPNMLCAEIFPTRVRGICIGICQAAMWLTNILVTELFPVLDTYLGIANTFAFFAFFCFVAWVFVFLKVPETRGMPLEIIVELFAMSAKKNKQTISEEDTISNNEEV